MDSLNSSSWLTDLGFPNEVKENLQKVNSTFTTNLIQTFGYINASAVRKIFEDNHEFQILYLKELKDLYTLHQVCFKRISCQFSFAEIKNEKIYDDHSLYSSNITDELIDADTEKYLSYVGEPYHVAKTLGLYSFKWIKTFIDTDQKTWLKVVKNLFLMNGEYYLLDKQEECLLYKRTLVKGLGTSISAMEMLYTWAKETSSTLTLFLEKNIYYSIFLKDKEITISPSKDSFQQYVIKHTFRVFFLENQTLLPFVKLIANDLLELFTKSEQAREDAVFYIDYLHGIYDEKKNFPLEEAALSLKRLECDEKGKLYQFLHTALCFFHCLKTVSRHKAIRFFMFHSLYQLPTVERQKFYEPIEMKYKREPFEVNKGTCAFIQKHFDDPALWASIFLQLTYPEGTIPSPYANLNAHIALLAKMETILDDTLPIDFVRSFLSTQSATYSLFSVLEDIQKLKADYDSSFIDFKEKWKPLRTAFMEAIDYPEADPTYLKKMEQLALTLIFSTHPALKLGFKDSTLSGMTVGFKELQFNENLSKGTIKFCNDYLKYLSKLKTEVRFFLLDALFVDQTSDNYNMMHSILHFMAASKNIGMKFPEETSFLFRKILAIPLEKRKKYDAPIHELKVLRIRSKPDFSFMEFAEEYPLSDDGWGHILLKISHTKSLEMTGGPFLEYLELTDLFKLIKAAKSFIMAPTPVALNEDILFFQLTKKGIFSILNKYKGRKELVKKNNFIALKKAQLCDFFNRMKNELIEEFDMPTVSSVALNWRVKRYQDNISLLADLLQFTVYPLLNFPFQDFIKETPELAFKPLNSNLPLGIHGLTHWTKGKEWILTTILKNPLKGTSCLFQIPLAVPQEESQRPSFFNFLIESIQDTTTDDHYDEETVLSRFAYRFCDCFLKGFSNVLDSEEVMVCSLKRGVMISTKEVKGEFHLVKWEEEPYFFQNFKQKLLFTFESSEKEFEIEWQVEEKSILITLGHLSHSLTVRHPHFNTDEEKINAIIHQAAWVFLKNFLYG